MLPQKAQSLSSGKVFGAGNHRGDERVSPKLLFHVSLAVGVIKVWIEG